MLNVVTEDEQPDVAAALGATTAVIDGTLLPCWSWADAPELYSGKHKTTGHNCHVLADLSGRLIYLSDPIAGTHHDAHALRETPLATIIDFFSTLADRGYQGTGLVTSSERHKTPVQGHLRRARDAVLHKPHGDDRMAGIRASSREITRLAAASKVQSIATSRRRSRRWIRWY